ncbi:unnamed protein product [Arabidopsis thaliana]|uniref:Uncharacterized protein n=1 Tax=Arabidopsis thaliana TaxID=3702 RepID=A0A5S9WY22_ARATH|nr:unnamed protein product [Arabidopsis thaliana]
MAFSSLYTNWRIRGLGFFKIRPLPSKPYGHGTLVSLQNTRPPLPRSYGHGTLVSLQNHVCRDLHLPRPYGHKTFTKFLR